MHCKDTILRTQNNWPYSKLIPNSGKDGKIGNLVKEIESFVDAIDPEICAEEWMIKSGVIAPSRLQQAISDMDAIRTDAWLLACMLAEADGQSVLAGLPGSQWN